MGYSEYKDLTPINNINNGEEYLNALEWALNNPKVKNIALAGPYGAGKSSIIETYLNREKDNNRKLVNYLEKIGYITSSWEEKTDSNGQVIIIGCRIKQKR